MKKGFTLVELLAVIVILAVILAIAVPSISTMINSAAKNAFESNAKLVLKGIEYKKTEDSLFKPSDVKETTVKSLLNIDDSNYQTLTVKEMNGVVYLTVVGKNKWDKLTISGTKILPKVTDTQTSFVRGANAPVLAQGMTPIKWNGTTWVDTTSDDTAWYNYDTSNKIWANARTADGSMWVWIPRYIYKISSGWHSNVTGTIDVQFSQGVDDNWNKAVIGNINLDESANASNNKWTNHPAFTFGDTELTGFWVAKFEASAVEGAANGYTADYSCPINGDNVTIKTIKIMPNVPSWRCLNVGNAFTASRNMEASSAYGWVAASGLQANGTYTIDNNNIDTHLMKNTEWGAVAYLSKSAYGKNAEEIYINNNQNYITGCAANSATEGGYNGCRNTYESTGGVKASTTGNIYGIYDLSGSAWERVSAYVDNAHGNLTGQGSSIINAVSKYKDVYIKGDTDDQPNNYGLAINKKGDAVYETSNASTGSTSWLGDSSYMPNIGGPWFGRGGDWSHGSLAGTFYFGSAGGGANSLHGFRPVLLVNAGL